MLIAEQLLQVARRPGQGTKATRKAVAIWVGLGLVITIWVFLAQDLWRARSTMLAAAEDRTQVLVRAVEAHVGHTLETLDRLLESIAEDLEPRADGRPLWQAQGLSVEDYLYRRLRSRPGIRGLIVTDETGQPRSVAGSVDLPGLSADAGFVRAHRESPGLGLFLDRPVAAARPGTWTLVASRRQTRSEGRFGGVVAAAIDMAEFTRSLAAIAVGPRDVAGVVRRDGVILARSPLSPEALGASLPQGSAFHTTLPHSGNVTFRGVYVTDQVERITSTRGLPGFPVVVCVGLAVDDVLASWWLGVRGSVAAGAIATLFIGLISWLLHRQLEIGEAIEASLRSSEASLQEAHRIARLGSFGLAIRTGTDLNCVDCLSDEALRILGHNPAGARPSMAGFLGEIVHPDDRPGLNEAIQHACRLAAPFEVEFRVMRPDGGLRHLRCAGRPLPPTETRVARLMGVLQDVTQAKQVEEALRQERNFNAAILDMVGTLVVVLDRRGGVIRFNQACERVSGYRAADMVGRRLWDVLLLPEERESVVAVFESLRLDGLPRSFENHWVTRNGERRLIAWTNTLIRGADGDVEYIIGAGTDITERQKAEAALRESELRFRRTFDLSPIGAAMVGNDYRFLRVNAELCRITGYAETELLELGFPDITHPDDLAGDMAQAQRLLAGEIEQYQMDKRYIRKDGTTAWIHLSVRLIRDRTGEPLCFLPMIEDITERKRTEAALRESEQRFRIIFEQAAVGIAEVAPDGSLLSVNDRLCWILGHDRDALLGRNMITLMHSDDVASVVRLAAAVVEGEIPAYQLETRFHRSDGGQVWTMLTSSLVRSIDGQPLYFIAVIEDITRRHQAEAEALAAKERAEDASRAKSEFLAAMTHELRSPLQSILLMAEMMAEEVYGPLGSARYRDYCEELRNSAKYLTEIINDGLDLARIEARRYELREEVASLRDIADGATRLVAQRAASKAVALVTIPGPVIRVRADSRALKQVLVNLLTNAIKFTPTGGRVSISAERDGTGRAALIVSDTGIGIPVDDIPRILEPFRQARNVTDAGEAGTGLGLAIAQRLSQIHGGHLSIESAVGCGTTVTVWLPAERVIDGTRFDPDPEAPTGLPTARGLDRGKLIAVIEDQPRVLRTIQRLLESLGHRVIAGIDAEETIERCRALGRAPDLIISDYRLGSAATGDAVISQFRATFDSPIPAVLLTGDTSAAPASYAEQHRCGLLHKPVDVRQLEAMIRRMTAGS